MPFDPPIDTTADDATSPDSTGDSFGDSAVDSNSSPTVDSSGDQTDTPPQDVAQQPSTIVAKVQSILADPQATSLMPSSPVAPPPATTTNVVMGCTPFTTGLQLQPSYFFKGTFDPDASDSESEAESPGATIQKPKNKKPTLITDAIFNQTKREGRKRRNFVYRTQRDPQKRRLVPRVNNRIRNEAEWPNLAADAKTIHDLIPQYIQDGAKRKTNQSFGATTIVCAVFKTSTEYRKIAFSNAEGAMAAVLRKKAHELGYHVVQALQAHAEGEMIQYCATYKHRTVVSMGCDKEHCAECTHIMQSYFGRFHSQTKSSTKLFKNYHMPLPLQQATGFTDRPSALPNWSATPIPTPAPIVTPVVAPIVTPVVAPIVTPVVAPIAAPSAAPIATPIPTPVQPSTPQPAVTTPASNLRKRPRSVFDPDS